MAKQPLCDATRSSCLVAALAVMGACGGSTPPSPSTPEALSTPKSTEAAPNVAETAAAGPPRDLDCGDFTTCAVSTDGLARCWGKDEKGELGDGATAGVRAKRVLVPGIGKVQKVALASQFGCALLDDKKVKCWGTGRIANDGKAVDGSKPVTVANVDDVEELAASGALACARSPRAIACWGADDKTMGTPPKGSFKQIAVGFTHACALDASGVIDCWGAGDWGGRGPFAKPALSGASYVVTGDRHGCVVTKEHTVQCWGMNDAGQLGMKPDTEPHRKPSVVPGLSGVTKLVAGEASTCALSADGAVRCWGSNGEGELGLGNRSPDERPTRVTALEGVEQLCLASAHACALTKQSKLLCWGSNAFGQLGDGTKERRSAPTPVAW